ncbi:hypothetical protein C8R44DRAFT_859293 [Mycena epipterygia]|nr:hypothetical protein C8R44DRAFT_859293 [Mycena epipterygia]
MRKSMRQREEGRKEMRARRRHEWKGIKKERRRVQRKERSGRAVEEWTMGCLSHVPRPAKAKRRGCTDVPEPASAACAIFPCSCRAFATRTSVITRVIKAGPRRIRTQEVRVRGGERDALGGRREGNEAGHEADMNAACGVRRGVRDRGLATVIRSAGKESVRTKEISTCEHGAEGWSGGGERRRHRGEKEGEERRGRGIGVAEERESHHAQEEQEEEGASAEEGEAWRTSQRADGEGSDQAGEREQEGSATKPSKEERERDTTHQQRPHSPPPPHSPRRPRSGTVAATRLASSLPRGLGHRRLRGRSGGGGGSSSGGVGEGGVRDIVLDLDVERDVDGLLVALEGGGVGAGGGWSGNLGVKETGFSALGGLVHRAELARRRWSNPLGRAGTHTDGWQDEKSSSIWRRLADTGLGHVRARSLIGFVGPARVQLPIFTRPIQVTPRSCASRTGNIGLSMSIRELVSG